MTVAFDVIAPVPEILDGFINASLIGKAREKRLISVDVHPLRRFAHDKHKMIDDRPFGGGAGMVLKPEPLFEAVESLRRPEPDSRLILFSPGGEVFNQRRAREMAEWATELDHDRQFLLICGRYEGIDERVIEHFRPEVISIGNYVLGGGETAAMVVIETVARLLPGVVGNEESLVEESMELEGIEYPHYTRPAEFRDRKVPDVLLSGHHEEIRQWREKMSQEKTLRHRPDLVNDKSAE